MDIRNQIKEEMKKDDIPAYRRNRLLAIKYHLSGYSTIEISNKIGISMRSIQRYVNEYTEDSNSLFSKRSPGNRKSLSPSQQKELNLDLSCSPQDFGFTLPNWNPQILSVHLETKYGIKMTEETCRLLLKKQRGKSASSKLKHLPLHKLKVDFNENINRLVYELHSDVWIFGQFYVGFRAAYKTKNKNKKRRATVLCAKQHNGSGIVCQFVNPYKKKEGQLAGLINAVIDQAERAKLSLFLPKSKISQYVANRFVNQSKKLVTLEYLPSRLLSDVYLGDVKYELVEKLKLPFKNTEGKTLGKRKQEELIDYLLKLSTRHRA
ncbi:helix-turn-helix domain-containing protein [Paenibacillus sp. PAMC21692]|uniref:helix-turn-helix domain-containing protein n=1 Tax=Paenibacillus sp. PAMC21692 TaxID=2762320 RepID=UPI00164DE5ED|nr:helix-turn-helix domain-containing protein [Paenibacillus sp. PAMC21692]QNK57429.1 hypothetical protein H7F31_00030 [Paenibacillus sp. PAMC21692]